MRWEMMDDGASQSALRASEGARSYEDMDCEAPFYFPKCEAFPLPWRGGFLPIKDWQKDGVVFRTGVDSEPSGGLYGDGVVFRTGDERQP
jgi:hypothetical protein